MADSMTQKKPRIYFFSILYEHHQSVDVDSSSQDVRCGQMGFDIAFKIIEILKGHVLFQTSACSNSPFFMSYIIAPDRVTTVDGYRCLRS